MKTRRTSAFVNTSARRQNLVTIALACMVGFMTTNAQAADPLASWNDGPAKQAIVEFVKATTTQGSPQFVPPEARIATFDQDGTQLHQREQSINPNQKFNHENHKEA